MRPRGSATALASDAGRTPAASGLVTATTDSWTSVASLRDLEMIHGNYEHMALDNLQRMTDFHARLIAAAARRGVSQDVDPGTTKPVL